MALNQATLKAAIAQAFLDELETESDREAAVDRIADTIAQAVHDYLLEAEIIYTSGLVAGSNPVTGVFVGNLQ